MALKAVALKEEGTHPPGEGVLARFAQVRAIRSLQDVERVSEEGPDIVLVDLDMPHLAADAVLQKLRRSSCHTPVFVCLHFKTQPARFLKQLAGLTNMGAGRRPRSPNISHALRLLAVSQEALARSLNVSARTAHRWLKGTRPRPKPELDRLLEIVSLLEQTLPNAETIRSYLNHSNPSLSGEKPIDLVIRGEFDRVAADLQAVQEGVYV